MSVGAPVPAATTQGGALERLASIHGPLQRRCALLALLAAPGCEPQWQAWERASVGVALAERIGVDVAGLSPGARLPVFEALLARYRLAPASEKRELLEHARRVIAAAGGVKPLESLRWLAMRHLLGEAPQPATTAASKLPAAALPAAALPAWSVFTAFLARSVPSPAEEEGGISAMGWAWHDRVLAACAAGPPGQVAPRSVPHAEHLLPALRRLQMQSWALRPSMLGALVEALPTPPGVAGLEAPACEALRLAASLLDAPLPPPLAARFIELPSPPGALV